MLLERYPGNPILTAKDVPYEANLIFNLGAIKHNGKYVMLFRNDYGCTEEEWGEGKRFKGTNMGYAESEDGIHWKVSDKPVFDLRDDEISRGYDPRLTEIDGKVYVTFAVDTKHGLRGGIAETEDFEHFNVISMSVPDNRNMVLFPEKFNGYYLRLERPMPVYSRGKDRFDIWMSESPDLIHWGNSKLVAGVEDFPYANDKVGPGAPPVKTSKGWLCFTHGVFRDNTRGKHGWEEKWQKMYYCGMMLLVLEDPSKVLGIYEQPILAPQEVYETTEGFRTDVLFPTAAIPEEDGTVKVYYGAADTVTALAIGNLEELADACLKK